MCVRPKIPWVGVQIIGVSAHLGKTFRDCGVLRGARDTHALMLLSGMGMFWFEYKIC